MFSTFSARRNNAEAFSSRVIHPESSRQGTGTEPS